MIGVVATIQVKQGQEAEFEQVFKEMTAQVKAHEPGNLMYQLTRSRADPLTYKVLEMYADDDALKAHSSSDHYKAGGRKLRDLVAAPPAVEVLDAAL